MLCLDLLGVGIRCRCIYCAYECCDKTSCADLLRSISYACIVVCVHLSSVHMYDVRAYVVHFGCEHSVGCMYRVCSFGVLFWVRAYTICLVLILYLL